MKLYPKIATYIQARQATFDSIDAARRSDLEEIARYVERSIVEYDIASLTFICTHNSRRSHLAQIWARVAADCYDVPKVATFSGGTEATAFNPRAVAALQRVGFAIEESQVEDNPHYQVRYAEECTPIVAFSKVYDQDPNPSWDFAAIMTCSQADQQCPLVVGAALRASIPYVDPKEADDTDRESQVYDERCRQIATEMLYLFSRVGSP